MIASRGTIMAQSTTLVEELKRELRERGITYTAVGSHLGVSLATVKRRFSRRDLSLERIDRICELASIEFSTLVDILAREERHITQLTAEQEHEIVADIKLFLVAVCALNH